MEYFLLKLSNVICTWKGTVLTDSTVPNADKITFWIA